MKNIIGIALGVLLPLLWKLYKKTKGENAKLKFEMEDLRESILSDQQRVAFDALQEEKVKKVNNRKKLKKATKKRGKINDKDDDSDFVTVYTK